MPADLKKFFLLSSSINILFVIFLSFCFCPPFINFFCFFFIPKEINLNQPVCEIYVDSVTGRWVFARDTLTFS